MPRITQIWLSLILAVFIGACSAVSLSDLHTTFERIQQNRADCSVIDAKILDRVIACPSDAALLDIARKAFAARDSGDDRTNVALLRLAAAAGWESRTQEGLEIAEAAAADGVRRCDALPAKQFGAPRDCALLRIAPAIVVHVRALNVIARVGTSEPGRVSAEDRNSLGVTSDAYVANTFDFIERVRSTTLAADAALDPSVLTYVDRQRRAFYCTAAKLGELNRTLGDTQRMRTMFARRQAMQRADRRLVTERCTA